MPYDSQMENGRATTGSAPIVIKIGGSTLGKHDTSLADCAALHAAGQPVVVVHGGGALVSDWLARLNVATEFVEGLRKTTAESRDVVVGVLCGIVNKQLVQQLAQLGAPAIGLSGIDGATLTSAQNERGLGFVGDAPVCDPSTLIGLLDQGLLPVVAPIGLRTDQAEILNINADTAAGAIATAIAATDLIFLTDVPGILDAEDSLVTSMNCADIAQLRADGTLSGGMLPKVDACLQAAERGAGARIVDGSAAGAIPAALAGRGGTVVV